MGTNSRWRGLGRREDKKASSKKEHAPDYRIYSMNVRELLIYTSQGIAIVLLFSWFFYRSLWASPFLTPLVFLYLKENGRQLAEKRRQELALEFRDTILSVAAGLQAGYSIENAFFESKKEVGRLYGSKSAMVWELERMEKGVGNNMPLETLLLDLGARSAQSDIDDFAEVFSIAKRAGGNMNDIIRRSAEVIGNKIEVKQEIRTLLSSKKYEQRIMNLIPFLIVAYLQLTSPGFFDVLYYNPAGILVMTGALAVYLAAYLLSRKIVEIEV